MVKLNFFVPESHLESVKVALFAAGAGKIGKYDSCCWQTLGTGQFRALPGSEPFLGEQGRVEQVLEYKVELVCDEDCLPEALAALKAAHPYEEPAIDVIKLESYPDLASR
jgi:hypothetical protein